MDNCETQMSKIPKLTILIVLVNVLVFLYMEFTGSSEDTDYLIQMGALWKPLVVDGHQYYRLIFSFFLHIGWDHLINNMISLLVLGYALEEVVGSIRFGVIYFMSGILAGVTSIVYNMSIGEEAVVSCGASGAIYGLSGALLILLIIGNRGKSKRTTEVPRYLVYLAFSLYSGMQDASIDNAAHVGGFIAGMVICFILTWNKGMEVTYES